MAEKLAVVTGAKLICPNATCPPEAVPDFISTNDANGFHYSGSESVACINDNLPDVNIFPFPGRCALGGPCKPIFEQPWINGVPSATDSEIMLLTEDSCIHCKRGKTPITIADTGQDEIKFDEMLECPTEINPDETPDGFVPYFGRAEVFHCGYEGYKEDRSPTLGSPQNECFYDNGILVDENHEYSGCAGSPNYYDSETDKWNHFWNDPGGIRSQAALDGLTDSGRKVKDDAIEAANDAMQAIEEAGNDAIEAVKDIWELF